MKNTDEAGKVMRNKGEMYLAVYERVIPKISSIKALINILI